MMNSFSSSFLPIFFVENYNANHHSWSFPKFYSWSWIVTSHTHYISAINRKSAKLFSISLFLNLMQGKIIQQFKYSFINFRMTISSRKIQISWRQSTGNWFTLPWRLYIKQSSHCRMDKTNNQTQNQIIYLDSRDRKRFRGHSSSFRNINNHRCFTSLWVIFTTIFWRLSNLICITTYELEGGY